MRWVAFVRNVMVGREGLRREVLIDLAREAVGTNVTSHLSTGNLTFTADDTTPGALADGLEAGVKRFTAATKWSRFGRCLGLSASGTAIGLGTSVRHSGGSRLRSFATTLTLWTQRASAMCS